MLRNAASKVAWVGRTASMVFGLALVMALVIGAASTAWSATGDNFILGRANGATTASKLTASVAGPALTLVNQGTDAAATALNISVAPGKPPLKVNAAAGTATGLSADEIDGRDSSAFLGKTEKAQAAAHADTAGDSDALDGRDSDAFATDSEVDSKVAEAKDDAWAYVIGNGAFHASSGNNVSATHPATGEYCFVVPERYPHKAAQVTLADPDGTNIVSVGTGHGSACDPLNTSTTDAVPVYISRPDGTAADGNFTIFVPAP